MTRADIDALMEKLKAATLCHGKLAWATENFGYCQDLHNAAPELLQLLATFALVHEEVIDLLGVETTILLVKQTDELACCLIAWHLHLARARISIADL